MKRTMRMARSTIIALGGLAVLATPVLAADTPSGVWSRDNGGLLVRISPCGASYCGVVIKQADKSSPAKPGTSVLNGMKQSGPNTWKGTAINPGDGKTYAGTMTVAGNTLKTSGCVLAVLCKSVIWTRAGGTRASR